MDTFLEHELIWQITFAETALSFILGVPFVGYSWYLLLRNRHKFYFVKRRCKFIILQLFLLTVCLIISQPLEATAELGFIGKNDKLFTYNNITITTTTVIETFDFSVVIAINTVFCLRFFILFYDLSLHYTNSIQHWKQSIAGFENQSKENNFFIKYKSTLGDTKWIMKLFGVLYLLIVIIFCLLLITINNDKHFFITGITLTTIFASIIFGVEWILVAIITKKFPKLEDKLKIRKELKRTLVLAVLLILLTFVYFVAMYFIKWIENHGLTTDFFFDLITDVLLFGMIYISVIDVINGNEIKIRNKDLKELMTRIRTSFRQTSPEIRLKLLLSTHRGYIEFMNFTITYVFVCCQSVQVLYSVV